MRLSKIEIHNFQSHRHTVLDLSDGFNCIIGETESGKSAILKAMDLVINNRPLGYDDYVPYWCKDGDETKISLTTSEGITVTRLRSKLKNQYLISTLSKPLEGFGVGVPDIVKEALNIHDINMQLQGFPYFLLNQSPPEVARYLNKLVNLEVIDTTFSNANKKRLSIKADLDRKCGELESLNKDLEEYKGLDEIEAKLAHFECLEGELEGENSLYENLCDAFQEMLNCTDELDRLKEVLKHEEKLNHLIDLLKERNELEREHLSLVSTFEEMNRLKSSLDDASEILKQEDKLNHLISLAKEKDELEQQYNSLLSTYNEMEDISRTLKENEKKLKYEEKLNHLINLQKEQEELEENSIKWDSLLLSLESDERFIKTKEKELKKLEDEFHSKFPDICPLCGKER